MGVFVCIVAFQVMVALVSIDVLSAVRGYVAGESLYSKGQKDALLHLQAYVQGRRESDYQAFLASLAVNLGDRRAREELQKPEPDLALAREGFLQGGNRPEDVDGLIRLFVWGHDVRFMAEAIAIWTEGDQVIEEMRALVERARTRILAGDADTAAVRELRARTPLLNQRLTKLERDFSTRLGDAAGQTQGLLIGLNLTVAIVLLASGGRFVRHSLRAQAANEAELISRKQTLRRLMDSTAEGIYGVDTQGHCTFINQAALEMLGYREESELLGRPLQSLLHPAPDDGGPCASSDCWMCDTQPLLRREHGGNGSFRRRDGTSFPVECWSHPVVHEGQLTGAVVTFFDISERLQMQAALREGELRIAKLVDTVTDGVVTVDAQRRVVLFNRAAEQLFGVAAAAAMGSPIERFVPSLRGMNLVSLRRAGDGDARGRSPGAVLELAGLRAGGDEIPLEASFSELDTEQGPLMTVVLRDMTEVRVARAERQAHESLEAASRAKTEFLARMSHELRTPLNAVQGFSELLLLDRTRPLAPDQAERVRHISRAGGHLLALVNDVLDLACVESRQVALSLETVDLRAVVEESIALVSPLAVQVGVKLVAPLSSRPAGGGAGGQVLVRADRVRLRQVMVNLLSNAVKYNRAGGSVEVDWQRSPDTCVATIRDTGAGMSPAQLKQLFQPFNRLGAERSKVEGTGIGLVLSRELLGLMHGQLEIDSEVGRGTVAKLVLPLAGEPPPNGLAQTTPCRAVVPGRRLRVVYAEDNEVNVELVRQIAALRPNVALRVAQNGALALTMARNDPPDLMLVDMNLGDMTGSELARALQRDPRNARVRLVALSADAMPEQINQALASGFEEYLTKPVDPRTLLEVLDLSPAVG